MQSWAQSSSDGNVFTANGIDPVYVWDGFSSVMVPAGVVAPETAPDLAGSLAGSITGTYYAFVRFVDARGNYSNLSPISDAAILVNNGQVDYTNIPVPASSQVVRKQIIRNVNGSIGAVDPVTGEDVPPIAYVDIDTTNVAATSLSSTRLDTDLQAQEQVLVDEASVENGVPPDDKPFLAVHQGRMYFIGSEDYRQGSVRLTFGSMTVQGYQTEWPETFVGRYFYTPNGPTSYLIAAVDVVNQTLTLEEPYAGLTDKWAEYGIKATPGRIKLVDISGPNKPESVNPEDGFAIPEDGDRETGCFNYGSYLYIVESAHMYRWVCGQEPKDDGRLFLACDFGCVNNRCWVIVNEACYLLSTGGVYDFRGDDAGNLVSTQIQDMFNNLPGTAPKINWSASRYFHACHSPNEEVIRWFVAINGDYAPRHAICYAYKADKWWVERWPFRVSASVLGRIGGLRGTVQTFTEQFYVGSTGGRVYAPLGGSLDGSASGGTVRGNVTSATPTTLTDSNANFAPGCVNTPVAIAEGRGRGQVRYCTARSSTELTLLWPWSIVPDETSVYVLGGVRYSYSSQRIRWAPSEQMTARGVEIEWEPVANPMKVRVGLAPDFSDAVMVAWDIDRGFRQFVTAEKGQRGQDVDMSNTTGYDLLQSNSYREGTTKGAMGRTTRLVMSGVGTNDQVRIGTVVITGAS